MHFVTLAAFCPVMTWLLAAATPLAAAEQNSERGDSSGRATPSSLKNLDEARPHDDRLAAITRLDIVVGEDGFRRACERGGVAPRLLEQLDDALLARLDLASAVRAGDVVTLYVEGARLCG